LTIWVDGDVLSPLLKKWLISESQKKAWNLKIVCDSVHMPLTTSPCYIEVPTGTDAVDHYISKNMLKKDLVITRDFPFAYKILQKEGLAMNDRGLQFTEENIKIKLEERQISLALKQGQPDRKRKRKGFSQQEISQFKETVHRILEE